jgi:tetratricopeptide (TPR) repeat protein
MASSARIDELRKKFDENPRRYFAPLANEYRKAGDLEQAIFICQEYLPQQPGHMSGHIVYGQALFELARFDESRAVFETALSLDPENLIALRHLGDIARQAGDLRGARAWYQRVLEADPRNEEIAQIMLTVLTTPHESHPGVRSGGTPLGTQVVSPSDIAIQGNSVPGADGGFSAHPSDHGSELTVGPELSQLAERQPAPEPAPEPEPDPVRRSPEAIPEEELLDLNDFSVGDIPMSSLGIAPEETPPEQTFVEAIPGFELPARESEISEPFEPFEASETSALPGDVVLPPPMADMVIERSEDPPSFEPDPYAIAAAAEASPVTLEADAADAESDEPPPLPLEAFAVDFDAAVSEDVNADSEMTLADPGDSPALNDLESFSDPAFGLAADPSPTMEVDSFFATPRETPAAPEYNDPSVDVPALPVEARAEIPADAPAEPVWTPALEVPIVAPDQFLASVVESSPEPQPVVDMAPVPDPIEPGAHDAVEVEAPTPEAEPEPSAFVTETMAELYLQQGHLEAALDIYQRLAEQRPGDERIREQILAVADAIEGTRTASTETTVGPGSYAAAAADEVAATAEYAEYHEETLTFAGPTIREFLAGILQPLSPSLQSDAFDAPAGEVESSVPPGPAIDAVTTDGSDLDLPIAAQSTEPSYDDSVFDTSAYGDAAALGEPPAHDTTAYDATEYDTTAYDTIAYDTTAYDTPAYDTPAFAATPAYDATPTFGTETPFEESPYEAKTLEIDLSGSEFRLPEAPEAASVDTGATDDPLSAAPTMSGEFDAIDTGTPALGFQSIDEEIGADTNEWQASAFAPHDEDAAAPVDTPAERLAEAEAGVAAEAQVEAVTDDVVEANPAAASRPTPSSSETVTGSIDALFSGADASTTDATAASTLAQAFATEMPETPPLQGMPAHRASDELSLDHVFKSNAAPRPEAEGEGFSFDQFFADDMSEAASKPGAEPTSTPAQGGSDDIAQFNNWLNGLKKT